MAFMPYKRTDGKPAKAPNGKPITANADCCNCNGGGGECCAVWAQDRCSFDANSGITFSLNSDISISGSLTDAFGPKYVIPSQNLNMFVTRTVTLADSPNCTLDLSFPVDFEVSRPQQGDTVARQVLVALNYDGQFTGPSVLGSPFPTDFFTTGPTTNDDATDRIILAASFGEGLESATYPDAVDFAGHVFGIRADADPTSPARYGGRVQYSANINGAVFPSAGMFQAVGASRTSSGQMAVTRSGCSLTMTSRASVTETFGSGAGRYTFRTVNTLTISYGPCAPAPGRPGGSVVVDPAVDAVFREQTRGCRGCGDGNPMA